MIGVDEFISTFNRQNIVYTVIKSSLNSIYFETSRAFIPINIISKNIPCIKKLFIVQH